MNNSTDTYYYITNSQYSVSAITDDSGNIEEYYTYTPYGTRTIYDDTQAQVSTSIIPQDYAFTGRRLDAETGLHYFRARYYDDQLGRFIQRDPIGYVDGMNLYRAYFVPRGMDPFGLKTETAWDNYLHYFLRNNPDVSKSQKNWIERTLSRGCVGVACVNIGKNTEFSDCYKTKHQAEKRKEKKLCGGSCPAIFSVHFWNDTGRDGENPDVKFNDATGKANLSNWDVVPRPADRSNPEGYVNFDFGYYDEENNEMIHADMYHNPDINNDGVGDYYPKAKIREATIYRSSTSEWQEGAPEMYQYTDFNAEVWCVTCKSKEYK